MAATIKQRVVDAVARRLGLYTQAQLRSAVGYAAAKVGRLTNSWTTSTLSADATIRNDLWALRSRSRQLAENNPYVIKWLSMIVTNVLGDVGMLLKCQSRDPGRIVNGIEEPGPLDVFANAFIERSFKEWGRKENCTVNRKLNWQQVNELCLTSTARDGDTFAQMVHWNGNKFGFALRLFESDFVDIELNKRLTNGNEIRMGIELNPWEEPVAYWMRRNHPNDNYYGGTLMNRYDRIEADEIVHPYAIKRLHQSRGVPWSAGIMDKSNMLDGYEEAVTVAARVNASSHGFFKRQGLESYGGETDGNGNKQMSMEPGQWEELPPGLEPHVIDLGHPNQNHDDFMMRSLRSIAAGLLSSYNVLAEDMSSVNFSSMRMGLQEPREVYKLLQCWWGGAFCQPIFEGWLQVQLSNPRFPLPMSKFEKFRAAKWKGRRWPYIEPEKEVDAAIKRMDANLSSLTKELSDLGLERDELLDEIAEDNEALKKRGLTVSAVIQAATAKANPQPAMMADEKNLADEADE